MNDVLNQNRLRPGHWHVSTDAIVAGLQWRQKTSGQRSTTARDNLDAYCILLDDEFVPVEVINSKQTRSTGGGVVHTGNSVPSSGRWDDERIFVFLHALPESTSRILFVVARATGRDFNQVRDASFRLLDYTTEQEIFHIDLTDLQTRSVCCPAILSRMSSGWAIRAGEISSGSGDVDWEFLARQATDGTLRQAC